ncbi:hypothetical protein BC941DRAFT_472887 [Chlamydoabsidia padenii]|nr:hypothetical protein BC941DRAFT_472887 [Chlamydoabsidia padenii]
MTTYQDACQPTTSFIDQHEHDYAEDKCNATTTTPISPYSTDNDTNTPYHIRVLGIAEQGAKSRVETQIRLNLELINHHGEKVQDWSHVRLPDPLLTLKRRNASTSTLITNRKRGEQQPLDAADIPQDTILHLRASVICESDTTRKVKMCQRCVWREWKRADRKKAGRRLGATVYDETLMERERQRILLFNSDPLLAFHEGECVLPTRITCYSRHHDERQGFRITFTMYDHQGKLVATGTSPPVMITDDHKNLAKLGDKRRRRRKRKSVSPIVESLPTPEEDTLATFDDITGQQQQMVKLEDHISPTGLDNDEDIIKSMDSFISMAATSLPPTDSASYLDPTLFFPTLKSPPDLHSLSLWSSPSSSPTTGSSPPSPLTITSTFTSPLLHTQHPQVERMIPDVASLEGGTEITILGSNFYEGLVCYFGDQQALTAYWSPTTLVCTVPPSTRPGPVLVTLVDQASFVSSLTTPHLVFTYQQPTKDPWDDHTLHTLTWQVLNLNMTQNVHDAQQIALRLLQM